MSQNRTLRFLLFGKIRFDDDSVGNNTIPGMEFFDSDVTFDAVTSTCTLWRGTRRGTTIEVIDCLDLFGAERTQEEVKTDVVQAVAWMHPGPLIFVYVVMVSDLYTEEERRVYETLTVLLGPDVTEYTIVVLLTRGDGRDRKRSSLQDVLSTAPDHVHKVLEECGHRYVVFDNAADDRQSQVEGLIEAVHKLSEKHGGKGFRCPKNSEIGERSESEVARRKQQELEEKSKQVQEEVAERERREQVRMEKERDEQTRKDKDRIVQLEAMVETLKQQQLDAERMHEKEMKCRLKIEEEKVEKIKEMERKTKEKMLTLQKKQRDMHRQRKKETTALEQKNQELQQMHEKRLEMERKKLQEAERQKFEKMEKEKDEQTRKDKDRIVQLEAMVENLKQQQLDAKRMHEKEMRRLLKIEEKKVEKIKQMERKTKEEVLTLEKKQRDMERQRKEETTALEQKNQELQQMHEKRLEMERKKLKEAERQKCKKMEKEMAKRKMEVDVEEAKRKQYVQEMEEKMKKAQEEMEKQKIEFERREEEREETMKRNEMEMSEQLETETLKLRRLTDERIHQAEMDFRRKVDEEVRKEMGRRSIKELMASGEPLRFLLVGMSGSGKSSTGNTILGMKLFDITRCLQSSRKTCCLSKRVTRSGINIEVMDTPGLDYSIQEEVETEFIQSVARMQPGPTAVLHVVRGDSRYTEVKHDVYERLKALLGPRVTDHVIVIFTHGDEWKRSERTIQEYLSEAPPNLHKVLDECGHRYVMFDNTADDTQSQVEDLLEKVRQLRKKNSGVPYTLPKELCSTNRSQKGCANQ